MTVTDLYRNATGDTAAHQRTISAALARLDTRRQSLIRGRAAGLSWRQLGQPLDISHGSAKSAVEQGLLAMHKRIRDLPRYHLTGRAPYRPRAA